MTDRTGPYLPRQAPLDARATRQENLGLVLAEVGIEAGRLFEGSRGAAGELGHVSIARDGRRCSCSKVGCRATFVDRDGLVRLEDAPAALVGRVVGAWRRAPHDSGAATVLARHATLGSRTVPLRLTAAEAESW